jgi:hypothetical protein
VVCVSADESLGETTQAAYVGSGSPIGKGSEGCTACHGLRRPSAKARYDALAALGQLWH